MYSLICRVMIRLKDGDKIVITGKSSNKDKNVSVLDKLKKNLAKDATGVLEDTLYYTIRVTKNTAKDNWKCSTLEEVYQILDEVFD